MGVMGKGGWLYPEVRGENRVGKEQTAPSQVFVSFTSLRLQLASSESCPLARV